MTVLHSPGTITIVADRPLSGRDFRVQFPAWMYLNPDCAVGWRPADWNDHSLEGHVLAMQWWVDGEAE